MSEYVAILGVKGGPAIRPGSSMPTSLLVEMAGQKVLIDAGLGVSRGICDQGVLLTDIDQIIITHLHSDHYLELGPLLHTAWTAGLSRNVTIHGPPGLDEYWAGFLSSMSADILLRIEDEGRPNLADLVTIKQLEEGLFLTKAGLKISAMRNVHPPIEHSFALRFETESKCFVFSGDTAFMPEMIEFSRGADLLVHEAMLVEGVDALVAKVGKNDGRLRDHILRSHTSASDVGRIASEAGVGRLALMHFVPDGLPGYGPEEWTKAVRQTWEGSLVIGTDGVRCEL